MFPQPKSLRKPRVDALFPPGPSLRVHLGDAEGRPGEQNLTLTNGPATGPALSLASTAIDMGTRVFLFSLSVLLIEKYKETAY